MLVSDVTGRIAEVLQDTTNITWTPAQLIAWLNDALRALTLVRPDSTAVTTAFQLAAGSTKQSLVAATDLRFISAVRNLGADGNTVGRAIRQGDMKAMNAFNPDWHTETGLSYVKEFMFDDVRPDEFWVYPKPLTAFYVEIIKQISAVEVTDVGDTLPVKEIYGPALIEWCCYRAFSRDSEETPNWQRAARHFLAFFNLLQVKMQADMAVNPKVRELVNR